MLIINYQIRKKLTFINKQKTMETPNERKMLPKLDYNNSVNNNTNNKDAIFFNITPMTFNTLSFLNNNTDSFKKYENYNAFSITPLDKNFIIENMQKYFS